MTTLALLLLVVAAPPGAPDGGKPDDAPVKPAALKSLSALKSLTAPKAQAADGGVGTQCGACHSTSNWKEVRFNHDRTGFKLLGAHATVVCKDCHVTDFKAALPRACSGCHRDVHAGELGTRCDGCHDPATWRSRFDAEAHRRTNFPLLGGHAAIPCVECHLEARERRFSRAAVDCGGCHAADYQRTATTALNHQALGFDPLRCRECHGSFRFKPARYPAHDVCFVLSAGSHSSVPCYNCHVAQLPTGVVPGTCRTGTASCISCHEHECSVTGSATPTDQRHAQVPGYKCSDAKCYECHQPIAGGGP
ncbi:MAG: cytochrome c3 family protein [Myxococcota bacterium]